MIYAIGVDTDSTFIHFLREATHQGAQVQPINLRAVVATGKWQLEIPDKGSSYVEAGAERVRLDPTGSFYCRIIDLSTVQRTTERAGLWRNLVLGLAAWLEQIPGVVINRPGGHAHNFSKPLHEGFLVQRGFLVPPSLTSSDPARLRRFAGDGATILKPVSGVRANTRMISASELQEFKPSEGPIHVQRYVHGADVRIHVVGLSVHAEHIVGEGVDYRATTRGLRFRPHVIPQELTQRIIETTAQMGLVLAGWDFKIDIDERDRYWCLEANPMPGYDGYDRRLGGKITESLLEVLHGENAVAIPGR